LKNPGNQTGWNSIERAVWKSKNTLNRVKANIDKIAMAPIDSGSRQRSQESMLKSYDKMQPGKGKTRIVKGVRTLSWNLKFFRSYHFSI